MKAMATYVPLYWCTVAITVNINNINNAINSIMLRATYIACNIMVCITNSWTEFFTPPERCGLMMWCQFFKIWRKWIKLKVYHEIAAVFFSSSRCQWEINRLYYFYNYFWEYSCFKYVLFYCISSDALFSYCIHKFFHYVLC